MSGLVAYLKLFLWPRFLFSNVNFSSYAYYYSYFSCRFSGQRHYLISLFVSAVRLLASNTNMSSVEDLEVLNCLSGLEAISGQKPTLTSYGSRYVGTAKRAYFSGILDLKRVYLYSFLELLSLFFIPNLQKQAGRFSGTFVRGRNLVICCKDVQLFENCFSALTKTNLVIALQASYADNFAFLDFLQIFKFNFQQ